MVLRNPWRGFRRSVASDVSAVSALDDPVRAAVFGYAWGADGEVSRDQAAAALHVSRRVAAFHLDRLAEQGWLDVTYRRLSGRSGPGAGRSSKLYRRSTRRVELSIPARNYELLARVIVSGAASSDGAASSKVRNAGFEYGRTIGSSARARTAGSSSDDDLDAALENELSERGFEPFVDEDGTVRLRNCPFHEMARENSEMVCSVNVELMRGVLEGLGHRGLTAVLDPQQDLCCVAFRRQSDAREHREDGRPG